MWKKHLERDDSTIVGKEGPGLGSTGSFQHLTAPAISLPQTCSQDSCAALCIALCAPTTPTRLTCSATCPCPFPRGAPGGR